MECAVEFAARIDGGPVSRDRRYEGNGGPSRGSLRGRWHHQFFYYWDWQRACVENEVVKL